MIFVELTRAEAEVLDDSKRARMDEGNTQHSSDGPPAAIFQVCANDLIKTRSHQQLHNTHACVHAIVSLHVGCSPPHNYSRFNNKFKYYESKTKKKISLKKYVGRLFFGWAGWNARVCFWSFKTCNPVLPEHAILQLKSVWERDACIMMPWHITKTTRKYKYRCFSSLADRLRQRLTALILSFAFFFTAYDWHERTVFAFLPRETLALYIMLIGASVCIFSSSLHGEA